MPNSFAPTVPPALHNSVSGSSLFDYPELAYYSYSSYSTSANEPGDVSGSKTSIPSWCLRKLITT